MSDTMGKGRLVASGREQRSGKFAAIHATPDLLDVIDDEEPLVVYIASPNVTMIAPVYERLAGILCEGGDEMAHVAIVARELGVPCAVQFELNCSSEELDGVLVTLGPEGELFEAQAETAG